ncbi:unnamed protein product [Blepharisma stoltei]|uniref:F-box/kelch-repeat protein n=1 Tax=Blepharisma stoltei TaxID=1481888 RepID=A0AAU9KBW9_9CILI|nr:unnamed protein product [Blepharisma stoltei]
MDEIWFGNNIPSGISVLIDVDGGVEVLPSGTPCNNSSCIYFNNSIYCFWGKRGIHSTQSSRFDLDLNRWIKLTPMPKLDYRCSSIIFNGNILISGYWNRNLWLYSIDIDSFSTIPYEFKEDKRKILINAERLYLIECPGSIYESEVGSYSNWKWVGKSTIGNKCIVHIIKEEYTFRKFNNPHHDDNSNAFYNSISLNSCQYSSLSLSFPRLLLLSNVWFVYDTISWSTSLVKNKLNISVIE